ncbi:MAG: hypothetical protein KF914_03155 [Rhizobiaceae bacterium]|nr:hypothetical protein [Rhizobiaceae bacterium]
MEHIAALLLIVGCSGDLERCTELPAPTPIYETYEECRVELKPALALMRLRQDRVFATCVPVDPAMEEQDAQLFWDIAADGRLVASVETAGSAVVARADGGDELGQTH